MTVAMAFLCIFFGSISLLFFILRLRQKKAEFKDETEKFYNRGIQMYRFPNSDVQKSVIFEGIKKRLKIV